MASADTALGRALVEDAAAAHRDGVANRGLVGALAWCSRGALGGLLVC